MFTWGGYCQILTSFILPQPATVGPLNVFFRIPYNQQLSVIYTRFIKNLKHSMSVWLTRMVRTLASGLCSMTPTSANLGVHLYDGDECLLQIVNCWRKDISVYCYSTSANSMVGICLNIQTMFLVIYQHHQFCISRRGVCNCVRPHQSFLGKSYKVIIWCLCG